MRVADTLLVSLMISAAMASVPAYAQSSSSSELLAMDGQALVGELTKRYEAGLSASTDKGLIAANDPRFTWALETKVQCAIAMGFMKSSTKDETSISKCAAAYDRMSQSPPPPAPPAAAVLPPPLPPRPSVCNDKTTGMVFFDFDSSVISPDAQSTLASLGEQVKACARMSLSVIGHTDQAGSDDYNIALSRQRADVVAAAMRSIVGSGVKLDIDARGERNPRVPLADGTRSPENRRVEISAE